MKTYAVHLVDRNGTPVKTVEVDNKRAGEDLFRLWGRALATNGLRDKRVVEVCLYNERYGQMLMSTANGDR